MTKTMKMIVSGTLIYRIKPTIVNVIPLGPSIITNNSTFIFAAPTVHTLNIYNLWKVFCASVHLFILFLFFREFFEIVSCNGNITMKKKNKMILRFSFKSCPANPQEWYWFHFYFKVWKWALIMYFVKYHKD